MREYELMAVYDLAVIEAGGQDASVEHLTSLVERNGGTVSEVDHWGRRRLAYPMNKQLDADYVVTRIELDPQAVATLNADFEIDERVYRHLVVRADELPPPRQALAPAGSRGAGSPTGPAAPSAPPSAPAEGREEPSAGEAPAAAPAAPTAAAETAPTVETEAPAVAEPAGEAEAPVAEAEDDAPDASADAGEAAEVEPSPEAAADDVEPSTEAEPAKE